MYLFHQKKTCLFHIAAIMVIFVVHLLTGCADQPNNTRYDLATEQGLKDAARDRVFVEDLDLEITNRPEPSTSARIMGDADGDGTVTIKDAIMVARYILGIIDESVIVMASADTNYDSEVTILDAVLITKYHYGMIDSLDAQDDLFLNGHFHESADGWYNLDLWNGVSSMFFENGEVKVSISNPGTEIWELNFAQNNINLDEDCYYELTFQARSTRPLTIMTQFHLDQDPWSEYTTKYHTTGTEMQSFRHVFVQYGSSDPQAVFKVQFGGNLASENTDIYFDNIVLRKKNIETFKVRRNSGLYRGMNAGNCLEAEPEEGSWGEVLEEGYFQKIKEKGFSHVRIPVRWETRAADSAPYTIDSAFFERVDWAIEQTLSRGMKAVINMHHHEAFQSDPVGQYDKFIAMWRQIANRYKDFPGSLCFEIYNEPQDQLHPELWNQYLKDALQVIRETNPERKVIIGLAMLADWNLSGLPYLEIPSGDKNLILTIHYYKPLIFTHQGAEYIPGSDDWLGITWDANTSEKEVVKKDFDSLVEWSMDHDDVPVYMGEFGVIKNASQESRVRWINYIAREAEKRNMAWAFWSFSINDWGVYDNDIDTWDTGVLNALIPFD